MHTTMKMKWLALGALFVGCAVDHNTSTRAVTDHNDLGVIAIETEHSVDQNDAVFELRGLDHHHDVVGSVRLHTGTIADLPGTFDGDDHYGSEIVMTVAGNTTRTVTRETELFQLGPIADAETQSFVAIPAVAAALQEEANIIVAAPTAESETAFSTQNCPINVINQSPTASQCCYDGGQTLFGLGTWSTTKTLVQRTHNPHGTACKAADGVSACSGHLCYYGPGGFARPVESTFNNEYDHIYPSGGCANQWLGVVVSPQFSDTTGSLPTGQGCPGGNSGARQWDY